MAYTPSTYFLYYSLPALTLGTDMDNFLCPDQLTRLNLGCLSGFEEEYLLNFPPDG